MRLHRLAFWLGIRPGSSLARAVCLLAGHRWAGHPYAHLVVAGRTVSGRCLTCLLHVHGDDRHRPCPLPTAIGGHSR